MALKLEEMRALLIRVLRQRRWSQIGEIEMGVGSLKAKTYGSQYGNRVITDGRGYLELGEASLVQELVWSLIVQGILVPGRDDSNPNWPFLRLTAYGEQCLEAEQILPHDPDGYLHDFKTAVPGADPIIQEYLTEALQCFLRGLNRAAAVMLGGASEKAVLLLFDSYIDSIADPNLKRQLESDLDKARSIHRQFVIFEKAFTDVKTALPRPLRENVDTSLRGIFDLIRNSRNEAGHPDSGALISRDVNFVRLRLFVPYCQLIYELINWFRANKT